MQANPAKLLRSIWFAALGAALLTQAGTVAQARQTARASALVFTVDEEAGPSDRGTDEGDDYEPRAPGNQAPSEDDTQQEAGPKVPDFGGCIFEKRDLGLLV